MFIVKMLTLSKRDDISEKKALIETEKGSNHLKFTLAFIVFALFLCFLILELYVQFLPVRFL